MRMHYCAVCVLGVNLFASVLRAESGVYAAFGSFAAPVPEASQLFGVSVAIDGDVIVVGASGDDDIDGDGSARGAAYVYRFDGAAWAFEQRITASDGVDGDEFGFSVDIDGDLIVVGSREPFGVLPNRGSAYVFRYSGGVWNEEQVFEPAETDTRSFGQAVSISGDVIAVGAGQSSVGGVFASGRVYLYRFDALDWALEDILTAATPTRDLYFGDAVSVDGDTVAVGAPFQLTGASAGLVGIYRYTPGGWLLEDAFFASDGVSGDEFGQSLSLDGDTVLVGAPRQFVDSGAAYVVRRDPDTVSWNETQKINAPGGLSNTVGFGEGVALEGSTAVISRPFEFTPEPVGVYRDSGTALAFEDDLEETTMTGAFTRFGSSVDASGAWVVVGSFGHPEGATSLAGRVFVYYRDLASSPDLDSNGAVDSADLAALLAAWGPCP